MEIKELRKLIKDCPCREWFQNIEVKIQHTSTNFEITVKGMENIYSFFQQESTFWIETAEEYIDNFFVNSRNQHNSIISQLDQFLNQNIGETEQNLNQRWVNIQNLIQQDNINRFYQDNSCVKFLISVFKEQKKYFQGAYHFFIGSDLIRMGFNKDIFIGFDLAKNFFITDTIKLSKKGELEKLNITKLKNKLAESIGNSVNEVIKYQTSMDKEVKKISKTTQELQKEHEEVFEKWYSTSTIAFDEFHKKSQKKR